MPDFARKRDYHEHDEANSKCRSWIHVFEIRGRTLGTKAPATSRAILWRRMREAQAMGPTNGQALVIHVSDTELS